MVNVGGVVGFVTGGDAVAVVAGNIDDGTVIDVGVVIGRAMIAPPLVGAQHVACGIPSTGHGPGSRFKNTGPVSLFVSAASYRMLLTSLQRKSLRCRSPEISNSTSTSAP